MKNKDTKVKDLIDQFPPEIASLIRKGTKSLDCPEEYLITSVLTIASISIGSSTSLRVKNGWIEHCSLYTVLVGNASMKKSPALSFASKPLRSEERRVGKECRLRWWR